MAVGVTNLPSWLSAYIFTQILTAYTVLLATSVLFNNKDFPVQSISLCD